MHHPVIFRELVDGLEYGLRVPLRSFCEDVRKKFILDVLGLLLGAVLVVVSHVLHAFLVGHRVWRNQWLVVYYRSINLTIWIYNIRKEHNLL